MVNINILINLFFLIIFIFQLSSSNYKCLSISHKSEFIINIKYGNYDGKNCLFDNKNTIYDDHLFGILIIKYYK